TGAGKGQQSVRKSRRVDPDLGRCAVVEGASPEVCTALGIPPEWAARCEDSHHLGHDGTQDALAVRLHDMLDGRTAPKFAEKVRQLGSYGGGNHFGECEVVRVAGNDRA